MRTRVLPLVSCCASRGALLVGEAFGSWGFQLVLEALNYRGNIYFRLHAFWVVFVCLLAVAEEPACFMVREVQCDYSKESSPARTSGIRIGLRRRCTYSAGETASPSSFKVVATRTAVPFFYP